MNKPWHTWVAFACCLIVVLAAMGWISRIVLRLDRVEEQARRQADYEGNVRLALWRMDSTLAPLIAQESVQPYFAYGSFYPAGRAYTQMFAEVHKGDLLIPSPLLTQPSAHSFLHFQFGPQGELTSPQVPLEAKKTLAKNQCASSATLNTYADRLNNFKKLARPNDILAQLPPLDEDAPLIAMQEPNNDNNRNPNEAVQQSVANFQNSFSPGNTQRYGVSKIDEPQMADQQQTTTKVPQSKQQQRSEADFQQRAQAYEQASQQYNTWSNKANGLNTNPLVAPQINVKQGILKPIWVGDTLVLARRVTIGEDTYVQGCWLDWADIQSWLKTSVADLVPNASFEPVKSDPGDRPANLLAAIPVRLIPGNIPDESAAGMSPTFVSLLIAWGSALVAAAAVAALLMGAMRLSERRGAFVSAVTHELRTPLTTFRMYTEMLSDDMVPDEAKRRSYLNTLRVEADRLSHLVENVLAYARLERGRVGGNIETTHWKDVLDKVCPRLAERAEQAGMKLVVDPGASTAALRTDASAVEQILFNLVDNACKYAANATDRVIHIEGSTDATAAYLKVRDHGPGFAAKERRTLFQPFSKSARQAAHSAPGVGLGLALSRRLAREMGGDLELSPSKDGDGACFVLTAPLA